MAGFRKDSNAPEVVQAEQFVDVLSHAVHLLSQRRHILTAAADS